LLIDVHDLQGRYIPRFACLATLEFEYFEFFSSILPVFTSLILLLANETNMKKIANGIHLLYYLMYAENIVALINDEQLHRAMIAHPSAV
jgi:hypothetical protein